jgi:hypothetical protein
VEEARRDGAQNLGVPPVPSVPPTQKPFGREGGVSPLSPGGCSACWPEGTRGTPRVAGVAKPQTTGCPRCGGLPPCPARPPYLGPTSRRLGSTTQLQHRLRQHGAGERILSCQDGSHDGDAAGALDAVKVLRAHDSSLRCRREVTKWRSSVIRRCAESICEGECLPQKQRHPSPMSQRRVAPSPP